MYSDTFKSKSVGVKDFLLALSFFFFLCRFINISGKIRDTRTHSEFFMNLGLDMRNDGDAHAQRKRMRKGTHTHSSSNTFTFSEAFIPALGCCV